MTLAEFLLARIAEDKSLAEDCQRLGADVGHLSGWVEIGSDEVDAAEALAGRFSPERVLAECEAKRRIIEEHRQGVFTDVSLDIKDEQVCVICHYVRLTHDADGDVEDGTWVQTRFPCPTLKFLAIPYASHPDHRKEWL